MLRIVVVGLVVLVVALLILGRQTASSLQPQVATILPESRPLPAVTFADKTGDSFATSDLAGEYTLLFFGFTHCPDICPLTLQVLAQVRAQLRMRRGATVPRVAFVSVDPYRDTPDVIAEYLDHFDSEIIGLTASDEALKPLLTALGVSVHRTEESGERYNMVHNGTIYVLDENGDWIALFGGSSHDPDIVATDYLRIRRLRQSLGRARALAPTQLAHLADE